MKIAFLTLAFGALALIGLVPDAQAGPRFSIGFGQSPFGHQYVTPRVPYSAGHGYSSHSYHGGHTGYATGGHCATPYVVQTCEISRRQQCFTTYDSCGRPYQVHLTVVTYRDLYSNGTCRTYTRTFR